MQRSLIIAATLAMTGVAFADDPAPTPAPEPTPVPHLTLGAGRFVIAGSTVDMNLSKDNVAKPLSFAPGFLYGVNANFSFGVSHDGGSTVWTPRPAFPTISAKSGVATVTTIGNAGMCVTGSDNNCHNTYDNIGADSLFGITEGTFSLAGHPGLDIFSFDPGTLVFRAGVLGRVQATDQLSIVFDPRVKLGLTERDFNKEVIDVPVFVWYQLGDRFDVNVNSGIAGPFDGFGSTYTIPLGVGAIVRANNKLGVGVDLAFTNLFGKAGSADFRAADLRLVYSLK